MKKVEFTLSIGFAGGRHRQVMEYADDVTDEELEEDYQGWVQNYLDGGWRVLDEESK